MKSRRTFLKFIVAGIISFFIYTWNKITLNHLGAATGRKKIFLFNRNKIVSFNNNFIIVTENNTTTVFSSHCTHLGCKIDQMEGNRLVCPCHGSEYDLNGKVIKGPAYKNLKVIPSEITPDGKHIEIKG